MRPTPIAYFNVLIQDISANTIGFSYESKAKP